MTSCPACGGGELEIYGSRTSTHHRGLYAGWTTTTSRSACPACGSVTTMTVRTPPPPPDPPPPSDRAPVPG